MESHHFLPFSLSQLTCFEPPCPCPPTLESAASFCLLLLLHAHMFAQICKYNLLLHFSCLFVELAIHRCIFKSKKKNEKQTSQRRCRYIFIFSRFLLMSLRFFSIVSHFKALVCLAKFLLMLQFSLISLSMVLKNIHGWKLLIKWNFLPSKF